MSAELATIDGEIIEQRAPMTLFGTDMPELVVERASNVASALAKVIGERELTTRIGSKDHVQVEGWTLLGSMLGVFAEVEWTHPLENGWEARAVARTLTGNVVGAAEAMCTRKERTWGNRDDYALRSMAQTRAVSKALRMPLGFIMHLAGYSATPAEEVDSEQSEPHRGAARAASSPRGTTPAPRNKGEALALLAEVGHEHGLSFAQIEATAKRLSVDRGKASVEDIMRVVAAIESPAGAAHPGDTGAEEARASAPVTDTPASQDDSAEPATSTASVSPSPGDMPSAAPSLDDILAATGGELVPPKPGTPEYRALPNGTERSQAKAYWDGQKAEPQQETLADALGATTNE